MKTKKLSQRSYQSQIKQILMRKGRPVPELDRLLDRISKLESPQKEQAFVSGVLALNRAELLAA